jgi:hypothetical protein
MPIKADLTVPVPNCQHCINYKVKPLAGRLGGKPGEWLDNISLLYKVTDVRDLSGQGLYVVER